MKSEKFDAATADLTSRLGFRSRLVASNVIQTTDNEMKSLTIISLPIAFDETKMRRIN